MTLRQYARMRSPSDKLMNILTATGLCSVAEVESCESQVRQLCLDLPDFDSVWLDALVQRRLLTPWQSEQILADTPGAIVVQEVLIEEALGTDVLRAVPRHDCRDPELLRTVRRGERLALRRIPQGSPGRREAGFPRLHELMLTVDRVRSAAPAGLILPVRLLSVTAEVRDPEARRTALSRESGTIRGESDCFLMSSYIPGWSLKELIIRGGRLPPNVVEVIGYELLTILAWLESAGLMHGEITGSHVRLDERGRTNVVGGFVRPAIQAGLVLSDRLTLKDCEGVAPELFGTARVPDARCDLYAVGCLLWQILAGRPVVLTADPVARMIRLSEQDVCDVRGLVPECPEWMARLIHSMTRRTPELRPSSAGDVLKQWKVRTGSGLNACRALVRSMPEHRQLSDRSQRPVRRNRTSGPAGRLLWPAAALGVMAALLILSARTGRVPMPLRFGMWSDPADGAAVADVRTGATTQPEDVLLSQGPVPIPEPDPDGVIRLLPGQSYLAAERTFPGDLRIICEGAVTATVLVPQDVAFVIQSRSVDLQGLRLQRGGDRTTVPGERRQAAVRQLLEVRSGVLSMTRCLVQSPSEADEFAGVVWNPSLDGDGAVVIRDSVFAGGGYGLSFGRPPRRCELDNVLLANRGSGVLCEFPRASPGHWELTSRNVTQRFGFSLLDLIVHPSGPRDPRLTLTSTDCAYEPHMAVVRFLTPETWKAENLHVAFRASESGNPAVIPPDVNPVVWIDPTLRQPVSLPDRQLTENSLLLAELMFRSAGTADGSSSWEASILDDFEGPKLTPRMPGIDASRLPEWND